MSPLARLVAAVDDCYANVPMVRVGGIVREVSPSHYRVSGLSRFVSLGERIGFESAGRPSIGEVVQIDEAGATVKSFDNNGSVGVGDVAFRVGRRACRHRTPGSAASSMRSASRSTAAARCRKASSRCRPKRRRRRR